MERKVFVYRDWMNMETAYEVSATEFLAGDVEALVIRVTEGLREGFRGRLQRSQRYSLYPELTQFTNYVYEPVDFTLIKWFMKSRTELIRLNNIHRQDVRICSLCNMKEEEDVVHFIARCPVLAEFRKRYFGKTLLAVEELKTYLNGDNWMLDYEVDLYLRQKWQDERLKHADITEVLDLNDPNLVKAIWKPEVYFPNAKHAEFQFVTVPNVLIRINPDGEILYMLRLKLTFSCMMDLSKFPLDNQICTMEVASFSKTIEELRLEWKTMNPVIMGKGLRMPQFEIVEIIPSDCQESFQIGNYSCLVAEFYLSRSVGFHLVQSYLPTILIVVISWVSFWMDVDSVPGRTTLGVTTLLAVSSQSSGIQSGLPQVSYVKAIDVWMGTCTAFVFCALLEFTFVNYMWRKLSPDILKRTFVPEAASNGEAPISKQGVSPSAQGDTITTTTQEAIAVTVVRKVILAENDPTGRITNKNMLMARQIDEYSRLFFPLAFAVFNVAYWSYYLA
ncbi:glycine receptor subunit alpha-2 [Nilaparvata lugens]|uniref:glycine receptor subunit alpha-2 n=1 Tax=Nilaparvata lugens TaxID=108931 RepID=UPI00193D7E4E|nr:glycine receptor subunit alpha-2 [Nilaparvata lugens]